MIPRPSTTTSRAAFDAVREAYNADARRLSIPQLSTACPALAEGRADTLVVELQRMWPAHDPRPAHLLQIALAKHEAALEAAGIDPQAMIRQLQRAVASISPVHDVVATGGATADERRVAMAKNAAEVQPLHRRLATLRTLAPEPAIRGIQNLARTLGAGLGSGTSLRAEMLLSALVDQLRATPLDPVRRTACAAIGAVVDQLDAQRRSPACQVLGAQAALVLGDLPRAQALLASTPPGSETPRSRALLAVARSHRADAATLRASADALRDAYLGDPLDCTVGVEAARALWAVGDAPAAQSVARTVCLEARRAFSHNSANEEHRGAEVVLSRRLGEASRLEAHDPSAFAASDALAVLRMRRIAAEFGLPCAVEFGAGAGATVVAAHASPMTRALFERTSSYRADGQVQAGNYQFRGIAHDVRFAKRVEEAFANLLEAHGALDEPDPARLSHRLNVLVRERFNTEQMEDIDSPFHKLFDQIFVLAKQDLALGGSSGWSVTDPAADFLECFGDCRQQASTKQMMFRAWQNHRIRGELVRHQAACAAGDASVVAASVEALEAMNRIHCRVMDATLIPTEHPEKAEEHTFPILVEVASARVGEPMGAVVRARAADGFYHNFYRLDAVELVLDAGERGEKLEFRARAGGSGYLGPWTGTATPYSGPRRSEGEVTTTLGLLRGCPWGDFGSEFAKRFSATAQRYRGVLSGYQAEHGGLVSAVCGRKLLQGGNDVAADGTDLFFEGWFSLYRDQALYLAKALDSTPALNEVRQEWIDTQLMLGSRQVRNTMRSAWLVRAVLLDDYAAFTEGQGKDRLTPATFARLRDAVASWSRMITPDGSHESGVPLDPFRDEIAFDLMMARAVTCDLGKSPIIRGMIEESVRGGPGEPGPKLSTIPEAAMAKALAIAHEAEASSPLAATHILGHLDRLPESMRTVVEKTMLLPNLGQLNQPLEAFPSMFKQITDVLAGDAEAGRQALGLWFLESFARVAGVAAADRGAEGYRNGSGPMREGLVRRFLGIVEAIQTLGPEASIEDCERRFGDFLVVCGVPRDAARSPRALLAAKTACTLEKQEPAFVEALESALGALSEEHLADLTASFLGARADEPTVIPRQLPQILRNLGGTVGASVQAMRAIAPLMREARAHAARAGRGETLRAPYQLDLMALALHATQASSPEAFAAAAGRARVVDFDGVDGRVVLEEAGGAA